jgi:hypothetical protein
MHSMSIFQFEEPVAADDDTAHRRTSIQWVFLMAPCHFIIAEWQTWFFYNGRHHRLSSTGTSSSIAAFQGRQSGALGVPVFRSLWFLVSNGSFAVATTGKPPSVPPLLSSNNPF